MRKRAERTLRELYDLTERITEPEITPVLEGSCRIQGPVDESDPELHRTNSVIIPAEKRMFMNDTRLIRAESGTCNVCSAPCSCCMHRTMSAMSSKAECMSSNNTCGRKEADTSSFIGTGVLPLCKSNGCDDPQHAASESSNILSASSSHDSYSENAESKVTLRAAVAYDASEDVDMPPKVTLEKPFREDQSGACGLYLSRSRTSSELCHRMSLDQDEQQVLECHDDNTSCVTGVRDVNLPVCDYKLELERKDTLCSPAVTCNLLDKEIRKVFHVEAARGSHDHEMELSQSSARKPSASPGESFEKKQSGAWSEVAELADKPDFGELSYAKENSLTKLQSSEYKFHSVPVFAHSADSKDFEGNLISQPLGETLECQPDNVESSFAGQLSFCSTDGQKSIALPNCEDDKRNQIRHDSSSGTLKINFPYGEADSGVNGEIPSCGPINCSSTNEQFANHGAMLESSNVEGSQMQLQLKTGGDNSEREPDGELDDVKVCDICGDAGREDLLATCSRCIDGAEHTYCMDVMLNKIPEGDWLCEICQLKEDHQKRTVDTSEPFSETSKAECLNENRKKIGSSFNPKNLPKLDIKAIDSKAKGSTTGMKTPQKLEKHADNLEVISATSKKTWETSGGFTGTASPRKSTVLSREGSFKNLEVGKLKPISIAPSPKSRSADSSQAFSHSRNSNSSSLKVQTQLHSPRGPLLKQTSFSNSSLKPKDKQVMEHHSHKQKISRDSALSNAKKEGVVRTMSKSASNKSLSSDRTSTKSVNRIQSFNSCRAGHPRKLKLVKERDVMEKKNSFNPDCPLVSPLPTAGTSRPKVDPKIAQHEGKSSNNKSDSDISNSRKGSNSASGLGFSEMKQRFSDTSKSFDMSIPEDKNPSQIVPMEDVQVNSSATDRLHREDKVVQRTVSQLADSLFTDDKIKDATCSSYSKQVVSSGSRVSRCHKCHEAGHASQFCPIDKFRKSAVKPADRNLREGSNKSNKWQDTVQATLTKSRIQKRKLLDQPEDCSMSSDVVSCGVPSKDLLTKSICRKDLPLEGTHAGTEILRSFDTESKETASVIDVQQTRQSVEAPQLPCAVDLNVTVTDSDELNAKQPNGLSTDQSPFSVCVVPKHEFVWQGGFEVSRTGRLPELCDGMQAHLSSCASVKVHEVAMQFPRKLKLEEVPCLRSWPLEFQGTSPKEDNIALFFFAKDIESYENTYRRLLENMLENDLALRGIINEAELLIFPSNKLPENSQCWNSLFFLWGIFRERTDSLNALPSINEKPCGTDFNVDPLVHDTSPPAKYEMTVDPLVTCKKNTSSDVEGIETAECPVDFHANSVDYLKRVLRTHSVSSNFTQDVECSASEDKMHKREGFLNHEASLCDEKVEQQVEMRISGESRPNKKRPLSCVTEVATQVPGERLKGTNETMMWKEMAKFVDVEDDREQKKMKCYSTGRFPSNILSSKLHAVPAGFSNEQQHGGVVDSEALMPECWSSVEKPLFPHSASLGKTTANNRMSCDDEDSPESSMPDLELALGGKNSLEKEVTPQFFPSVGRKVGQDKLPGPGPSSLDDTDDMSTSLSLSLAFPGMEKEQTAKPVLKTEQFLPERPCLNTTLLLFGCNIGS